MPDLDDKTLRILAGLEGHGDIDAPLTMVDEKTGERCMVQVRDCYRTLEDLLRACEAKGWVVWTQYDKRLRPPHSAAIFVLEDNDDWDFDNPTAEHVADTAFAALLGAMLKAVGEQEPNDG